jgi:hypothetical protein
MKNHNLQIIDLYASKHKNTSSSKQFLDFLLTKPSEENCIIWPYYYNNHYPYIQIDHKSYNVRCLICEKFYGPAEENESPFAKCGHTNCVEHSHLEWYNKSYRRLHGKFACEKTKTVKLVQGYNDSLIIREDVTMSIFIYDLREEETILKLANAPSIEIEVTFDNLAAFIFKNTIGIRRIEFTNFKQFEIKTNIALDQNEKELINQYQPPGVTFIYGTL